ncbi:MAG: hypothetical protein NT049_17765 [Planctomycetota bacterium]|nr:hypothetical protein [Planctomycetota bacterium]
MSQMQSGPQGAGQGTGAGGAIPAAPRSKWPKVIGIISIVLASLAIICTPASLAMQKLDPNQRHVFEQLPGWFNIYMTVSGVLGVLVGVLFLAAGITLVLRKPAARPLHLVYACLAIIMCLVGIFVSVAAFSGAPVEGSMKAGMVAGFACSLPLGLAYPVFLLIWFLRGSIARETASWRGPPQG